MAELVTLEQHMDRELPTVATQATTEWVAVLALVYLQEGGLGVHLHVHVCCYCMVVVVVMVVVGACMGAKHQWHRKGYSVRGG